MLGARARKVQGQRRSEMTGKVWLHLRYSTH